VQNSDCVISSDSVDREITESSEVQQLRVELYRVNGRRRNCDTADDSNCKIANGVNVRSSGINSLYAIRREVTCRALYTQHVTICYELKCLSSSFKLCIHLQDPKDRLKI
jgi:hypothetical protein